jgi:signal transduction histidine kinase
LARIGADRDALFFKCDFPNADRQSLSTIVIIHAPGRAESLDDFALRFCRVIAQHCDVSGLLFEILDERKEFDDRVRRSSHASKTPLQSALSALETLNSLRTTAEEYQNALPGIGKSIRRAATEITEILSGSTEPKRPLDLCEMVASLLEEMAPIAGRYRVTLAYQRPPEPIWVEVRELDIRTALRNLIDNAIKYSYQDKEVRIALDVAGPRLARLVISNYGIGIELDRLAHMAKIGSRGNIPDPKAERAGRTRPGSGFGLTMAISDIEAHGGSLNLESEPADEAPREACHRYVTTATVTLPITMENHDEE